MLPLDHPDRIQIAFDDHRVKGGGKTYHWAEQNCTTGVMPDGHGLAGWAGGLAWSGAGAGLGRALIGGWPIRRWR